MTDRVWEEASRTLRQSAPYRRLLEELGDVVRLPVPAAAWVAELLAEDLDRPVLAVVPREADALAWLEAAALFGDGSGGDPRRERTPVFFPGPSLTPYQEAAASLHVRAQEVVALDRILTGRAGTVVTTPRALFRRLPDRRAFARTVVEIRRDEEHPLEALAEHLSIHGYRRTDLVSEVGDYAVRGGIVDVYPPGEEAPLRIELFGDTVDTIRRFDPVSQRSEERVDEARLLPVLLYPGGPDDAELLAELLADVAGAGDREAEPDPELAHLLAELRERGEAPGWLNYLPLLAPRTVGLDDWLGRGGEASRSPLVVSVDPPALDSEIEHYAERLAGDHRSRLESGRLAVPPEELEHPVERVAGLLEGAELRLRDLIAATPTGAPTGIGGGAAGIDFGATTTDVFHGQLPRFPREVESVRSRGERCVVVVAPEHRQGLAELLDGRRVPIGPEGVEPVSGELQRGFRLPAAGVSVYGEHQLLPRALPRRKPGRRPRYGPFISGLRDLKVGDYVVHADHGIGQFVALRSVDAEAISGPAPATVAPGGGKGPGPGSARGSAESGVEVMEISYSSGQCLLLPLSRLDQLQKYSGIEGVAPRLDKLGGTSWNRTKARVKKSMRDMAGQLLKLYAERQVAEAPAMPPDSDWMHQFDAAFPYEETGDQLDAIAAIKEDLEKDRPMDRLLCGDVGYGKTEVAMRAAFKAIDGGYQVAVLAPTTILADQHLETFRDRFEDFPVQVEMISRFRTPAEVRAVSERLAAGEIDILVGTHRLLSRDVKIPRLGLLIVDEEQRFGVAQKERLKQLKKDVHVLAMSATPVPRTLQLSLAGVRDLSVIETPPKDRMAVETAVVPFNNEVVREAIEYELERGGQVYFVHNRVESIEGIQTYLRELVPRARITVGHGQLDEKELSRRMHAFSRGDYDVLLATTIIENGIDIPNVNTMIVHRAERFGLAQLYQLRGRVGRSNQLAYCYLLIPGDRILPEPARKRLAAIREFTDLGSGFRIAARDLEIRGAGNLLGAEQSGHIAAVGIETYIKMLEDTVRELKGEAVEEAPSVAIDLPVPMAIPPDYVADANLRMEVYQKLAAAERDGRELLEELSDRFGPPPPAVQTLLEVAELKRTAEALRVQSISGRGKSLTIRLRRDSRVDVERLIELVSNRDGASFSPSGVLTLASGGADMLSVARATLGELAA
ncbi:MAG: transcription-repair coupling factor [Acidobacteriota bacterium]|jgi:transcription-repair coupling factor (superfamily II helicase)